MASLLSSSQGHSLLMVTVSSCQFFMNMPITSYPCSFSKYAVTLESTPPDNPTTTRLRGVVEIPDAELDFVFILFYSQFLVQKLVDDFIEMLLELVIINAGTRTFKSCTDVFHLSIFTDEYSCWK